MIDITINIEASDLLAVLRNLEMAGHNMSPAFRTIATELVSQTEDAFGSGGPGWPGLAESTIEQRAKRGHWPGPILQVSGQLAASVDSAYGAHFAQVGAAKVYAAIQQLGGEAGRGHRSVLPPRPYLPVDESGSLKPEAEEAVLDSVLDHLARSAHS